MNIFKKAAYFAHMLMLERQTIWGLAKNDLRSKFASSFLGGIWAYIQPLVTLLVFWFVFQAGFKNPPVNNVPFIIWLAPAYLSWAFFSETLASSTNSLLEYSYLVKKVNFRVSIIPILKIISSSLVHVVFIGIIFIMLILCRVPLSLYNLQVFYYFFCTCVLLLGLGWLLSAVTPFVKDTSNIVGVFIQIGFWATPVFWSPENMSDWVKLILKVNPMYYICRGYRDSFIDHVWFWQRGWSNLYFWGFSLVMLGLGAYFFKRLRPHFADVL